MSDSVQLNLLGKPFLCTVCGGDKYRRTTLTVRERVQQKLFQSEQPSRATVLVCKNCGYIHWFFPNDAEGAKDF